jgi:hypothetical protein
MTHFIPAREVYNKYVGLQYKKLGRGPTHVDCWGVVYLFHQNEMPWKVPSFDIYDTFDDPVISTCMAVEEHSWVIVPTSQAVPGDVLMYKVRTERGALYPHCGIMGYDQRILHILEGAGSVYPHLEGTPWSFDGHRFLGVHRYLGASRGTT